MRIALTVVLTVVIFILASCQQKGTTTVGTNNVPKASTTTNLNKVNSNSNTKEVDMSIVDKHGAYMSMVKFPVKMYLAYTDKVPTQEQYKDLLDKLPWVLPHGFESITYVPDADYVKATIECLNYDKKSKRKFVIGNKKPATDPEFIGGCTNCDNWDEISKDPADILHLLRASYIRKLLNTGTGLYNMAYLKPPKTLSDIEDYLGLVRKPNLNWSDYGISFDDTGETLTITYTNPKIPEKYQGTSKIEYTAFGVGKGGKKFSMVTFP